MNKKIENAKRILLKEDRFYDDDTEIKATKILLEYIKELEQKKSILDKIENKLVEDKLKLIEELKYNITKREARLQLILVDKYLNIIEGEKK